MRTAKVVSMSLTPDMEKEVVQVAKAERRTISEILREAFRQYMANRDLANIRTEGRKTAKVKDLTEQDVVRIVKESRK
ncbi:MAG: ribbon-helix-helix protein, CopG family [Deltaproteobacteria bacterium]|nr:ribbon-helix-helix protein, CopG family [Deltaproteobacteria bacterium]